MTEQELLEQYGLPPKIAYLDQIRNILRDAMHVRQRDPCCGNVDLLKLCCVQLFSQGEVADSLLIWECKRLSEEVGFAIDIQLLCGAGLEETKKYLMDRGEGDPQNALKYINECEEAGDFSGFAPKTYLDEYIDYYSD